MGIILGRWIFPSPALREAATVAAIAAQLRQTTGLGVRVEGGSLVFDALGARVTLHPAGSALEVEGGIPPHPYLWARSPLRLHGLAGLSPLGAVQSVRRVLRLPPP